VASPAPPAPGGSVGGAVERFEVIVGSFRTNTRADSLADDVMALGFPTRRRAVDGWEQVLVGPFSSRAQADEARQRLDTAGLTGSQIVPAPR
jgi:cell division protein FtsN